MEITDQHVEWAVVHQLKLMLEAPNSEFTVTYSYALFTTILCWVVQRIRTNGNDHSDVLEKSVLTKLNKLLIREEPFLLTKCAIEISKEDDQETKLGDLHADQFFIALRNECAHGDSRKVKPNHVRQRSKPKRVLNGFIFDCTSHTIPPWIKSVTLTENDLRRLGTALAEIYCGAFQQGDDFVRDADEGVMEAASQ